MGCLFLLLNLAGGAFLILLLLAALNATGLTNIPVGKVTWILPLGGVLLVVATGVVVAVGTNVRRMSVPLDNLLNASHNVAHGDYSVRVEPRGTPEVRSLAEAFNSMAEQLEVNERQRRTMLADVSHELRTPLTVIQGTLEGMLDGLYPADEGKLRSVLEETQILARLTDDLRTLAVAESGVLQLEREPNGLAALMRETVGAFQSIASSRSVAIELAVPEEEITLTVDAERIRQVLGNLISNALRYSPDGGTIRVELQRIPGGATFSVADAGPGISAADLPHVFDRYYKSADSRGMGLGLAIAKYLVEAHGGQIQAHSGPGTGTRISFTLPG